MLLLYHLLVTARTTFCHFRNIYCASACWSLLNLFFRIAGRCDKSHERWVISSEFTISFVLFHFLSLNVLFFFHMNDRLTNIAHKYSIHPTFSRFFLLCGPKLHTKSWATWVLCFSYGKSYFHIECCSIVWFIYKYKHLKFLKSRLAVEFWRYVLEKWVFDKLKYLHNETHTCYMKGETFSGFAVGCNSLYSIHCNALKSALFTSNSAENGWDQTYIKCIVI